VQCNYLNPWTQEHLQHQAAMEEYKMKPGSFSIK
jgi:hypothetical protein